jgi:hypothetical protein
MTPQPRRYKSRMLCLKCPHCGLGDLIKASTYQQIMQAGEWVECDCSAALILDSFQYTKGWIQA